MAYPNFHVGELLHSRSDLIILDREDLNKTKGQPATPINNGGTGTVWRARQATVIDRAVKVLSPEESVNRQNSWDNLTAVFEKEMHKLAYLRHSHLVKLISFGHIPAEETGSVAVPYIVMEYVEGTPLNEYIASLGGASSDNVSADVILDLFDDVLSALVYMHTQDAFHSDVKEMNILVHHTHRPEAVLVDLGAAHVFGEEHPETTQYVTTPSRVPQEWQERQCVAVSSTTLKDNRIHLDLYMFGAMLTLLLDGTLPENKKKVYDWSTITHEALASIFRVRIRGLARVAEKCMQGRYNSADDVRQDLEATRDSSMSPFGISELSIGTDTTTSLSLPETSVPLTYRMTKILNHPSVQRLRHISQLDFVNLIYLGATHTRLLHSVETYNLSRSYVSILLGDPIFRSYCPEPTKLEAALLAGLLHDLGHYPLGHVFEDFAFRNEAEGPFANIPRDEDVTNAILNPLSNNGTALHSADVQYINECRSVLRDQTLLCLPDLIEKLFGKSVLSYLCRILGKEDDDDEVILILRSMISGPLDVDKVCYLRRDSSYSGAAYGSAVDIDGILGSLACTVKGGPSIAIRKRGICAAESIATARRWMYQSVYWHRTNRAIMAMVRFAPQYLLENDQLTFSEYFQSTYALSDCKAMKWLDTRFSSVCNKHSLENPAEMISNGRRGVYKLLCEFSPTDTDETDHLIREFLMNRQCCEWSRIATAIASLAQAHVPGTKVSDILVDIPSPQRHRIGDPSVLTGDSDDTLKLSAMSEEFRSIQEFFEKGALSSRIFIHPRLRDALTKQRKLANFREEVRAFLVEAARR